MESHSCPKSTLCAHSSDGLEACSCTCSIIVNLPSRCELHFQLREDVLITAAASVILCMGDSQFPVRANPDNGSFSSLWSCRLPCSKSESQEHCSALVWRKPFFFLSFFSWNSFFIFLGFNSVHPSRKLNSVKLKKINHVTCRKDKLGTRLLLH